MKRKSFIFVIFLSSIFFVGCASQKMYYYGNYSQTLYSYEKNKCDETFVSHQQELEKIIAESKVMNLAVPPGIYAELGYICLKANNSQKAINLFQLESQLYPESKHFMDRLIQSAKSKEDVSTNERVSDMSISKGTVSNVK